MRWTYVVIALLLVLGGIIPLAQAQCDTQAIQILLNEQTKQVVKNTDDSFKAYEQFNTKQMGDFLAQNQGLLQQSAIFLLIALFAMVMFTTSLWSLIRIKREKQILLMISEDMHYQRKIVEAFMRKAGIQPEEVKKEMDNERQKEHQPTERELKKIQKEQERKEKEQQKQLQKMQRDYQKQQLENQKKMKFARQQPLPAQPIQYSYPYPYNQQPQQQMQQPYPQPQPQPQQYPQAYPNPQQQMPQQQMPQQQQFAPQQQPQPVQSPHVGTVQYPTQPVEVSGMGGTADTKRYHL
jgi:FtsZ-interacting cell division protein ZipA